MQRASFTPLMPAKIGRCENNWDRAGTMQFRDSAGEVQTGGWQITEAEIYEIGVILSPSVQASGSY